MTDLKQSKVWDARFDLPLVPEHNNPHVYGSYIFSLLGEPEELRQRFAAYIISCETAPGQITRWPDGSGGRVSHDEIFGAASFDSDIAQDILWRLFYNDGLYNKDDREVDNNWRFFFLTPYLRSLINRKRPDFRVSLWSKCMYVIPVLISAILHTKSQGASGPLKIWKMNKEMRRHALCGITIRIWEKAMLKKGITLAWLLQNELGAYPELLELLPEKEPTI
jgi:hypothetical protein